MCYNKNSETKEACKEEIMFNLFLVLLLNVRRAPYVFPKMRRMAYHPEKYSTQERYEYAVHLIHLMKNSIHITTKAYGLENLPQEGGYIIYPNHQGKYDVLGIMDSHDKPLSIVLDKFKSHTVLIREFVDLLQAKRLEKNNPRQGILIINQVAKEISEGKRYILFPEGGYTFNNKNRMSEFKAGSFKIALKSKAPIVPVALIDSYKVYNSFHIGPITTYVYYLEPIYYEEYMNLKSHEIATMVHDRIEAKIAEELAKRDANKNA